MTFAFYPCRQAGGSVCYALGELPARNDPGKGTHHHRRHPGDGRGFTSGNEIYGGYMGIYGGYEIYQLCSTFISLSSLRWCHRCNIMVKSNGGPYGNYDAPGNAIMQDAYTTSVKVYDSAPKGKPTYIEHIKLLSRWYHAYAHRCTMSSRKISFSEGFQLMLTVLFIVHPTHPLTHQTITSLRSSPSGKSDAELPPANVPFHSYLSPVTWDLEATTSACWPPRPSPALRAPIPASLVGTAPL